MSFASETKKELTQIETDDASLKAEGIAIGEERAKNEMCKAIQEMREESKAKGIAEGIAIGEERAKSEMDRESAKYA